jgi:hypothetical protein
MDGDAPSSAPDKEAPELIPEDREGSVASNASCTDFLWTTFAGGNGHNGNMFDLVAKDTLLIDRFEGNLQDNGVVAIFYKEGSHVGNAKADSLWTFIDSAYVVSEGTGVPTEIPIDISKDMSPGDTMAFYITMTVSGNNLSYTNGSSLGSVYTSNSYLELLEGYGVGYPFAGSASPRVWNGIVNYCEETTTSTREFKTHRPQELRVHPNPSDGHFRVDFSSDQSREMIVRDAQGRIVLHRSSTTASRNGGEELDLSHLPQGLYHLQVGTAQGMSSKKLILR